MSPWENATIILYVFAGLAVILCVTCYTIRKIWEGY